ncbi:heavy metal translocating P-type ATPase [Amycolatopsis cynarae]|uniref:Heavy metal translocating P-type ATPase n=1 Tax=Amycolatopsis cynarae TaxID=2995223 RepID=A0ABY7B7Q8_9PSEU|nr:heavy metal translocating P-type ATPase [Amycolatopsis sp. HUAS 11-8]WAL68366.1 heavy metal translocating P-type ATPase [Amycolatopsis sp. HUAS 11-8]
MPVTGGKHAPLSREALLLIAVTLLVAAGGVAWLFDPLPANILWAVADGVALVPALFWVAADLRAGRWGADLLAVLALGSTLAVGEYLAGAIIGAMVATGRVLEVAAQRRAGRDLSALLERAPSQAHLRRVGRMETVPIAEVRAGDRVVVLPGEIVPVDGTLLGDGVFDESALTGEAAPVTRAAAERVRSGVVNAGGAVDLSATATADASTYAGVVQLARQAAANTAPVARLADRIAVWFLPTALIIAAIAWAVTGNPDRAVAVLVTATPCPLLLAVPIAVTGGMSRASRAGVVVRGGAALELLGRADTLAMDKTGTVTEGRPEVVDVVCAPGVRPEEALAQAAAVEQYSPHVLAGAVLRAAERNGVHPAHATSVTEEPGRGATGVVDGTKVTVGRLSGDGALPDWAAGAARRGRLDLASMIWTERDGTPVAALLVRDRIRHDAARTMRRLRAVGLRHVVLLTGDRVDNATEVAGMLGVDDVQAEASPADKIERVRTARSDGITVMVGDGINDAPALAAADVGIALGSRGSTAAAQAADAVILDDRIDRLADAVEIARRARGLAVQSAGIGTVLSLLAMVAAAFGWLIPVVGALVQEGIDVAVILNALRALRGPARQRPPAEADELLHRFAGEHEQLLAARNAVRQAADALAAGTSPDADAAIRRAHRLLVDELLPHERAEETELYPALGGVLGSPEGTVTMSRGHVEIERLVRRLGRHLAEAPDGIQPDQVDDLRATLYGLDAVLTLHFAQEEEAYFSLASSGDGKPEG